MNVVATALAAAVLAAPAAAQSVPADVFPLDVGNRWEYVTGAQIVLRWEVVGEATVGGERIARLQFDGGAVCGVRTSVEAGHPVRFFRLVDPADPAQPCPAAPATFPGGFGTTPSVAAIGPPSQQTVQIGSQAVTGATWGNGVVVPEPGLHHQEVTAALEGVGLVSLRRTFGGTGNPQTEVLRYRLAYARIRGTTYGTAVAGEPDAPAERALTLAPNPARSATTLRFAAQERPAEALVRDALGRVVRRAAVPAGAIDATLDVTGLAAGVYVATVGTASVRLVVAR